jgi:transketolase
VFADYMRPAIRVAALMKLPVIYVFTHDSVAVGEDGPTHQPVEHLAALRAIPNLTVIRPADATETAEAWRKAISMNDRPVALILSRQKLPILDASRPPAVWNRRVCAFGLQGQGPDPPHRHRGRGSHYPRGATDPGEKGIAARVVNMPSWEIFEEKSGIKKRILPPTLKNRIAVEAGISMGWERYVGPQGKVIGIDGIRRIGTGGNGA